MTRYSSIDLHCHSTVSDGIYTPSALASLAYQNGVKVWSLTDHDEVGGQQEAQQAASDLGIRYITGIEISVTWLGKTLHMVGLNYDIHHTALLEGLQRLREDRVARAHKMASLLTSFGLEGAFEGALALAGNPDLLSRTHFARYMVNQGFCHHLQEAFDIYLGDGKKAYVAGAWATLEQAINWVIGAGGIAVIAHPGRYKYSEMEFAVLFDQFKSLGGQAIEVVTGSHRPEQYQQYADVAKRYGFLASCGSDFHGVDPKKMMLGCVPDIDFGLTPVWHTFL
ncbi:PHP domain-containing protein [Pelistega sp. NLN82]|uniref:PHP domain-containing protein n=1 Tax=Pelistega ratti TaxID=2652177 RepID=A0A6L9Y4L1_9BURK|nr:PHP domain-containing protein [Pelistega ratti]NEN75412.1 PHP domain-containing protein [Pelistega ratti]